VTGVEDRLVAVLEQARERGYLGPGPVTAHLEHARGYVTLGERLLGRPPVKVVDLGSGGGVPGLVLAAAWPDAAITLIEGGRRRARDLAAAAFELFGERIQVLCERAELCGHETRYRERFELVTARSFGPPAVTSEIGAGLVMLGGWLLVSEPPGGDAARWPASALGLFGFGPARSEAVTGATFAALHKVAPVPAALPRVTKALVKRPAW
jgi:16S rRNA (guanine527-N7)-methyltransferase